MAEYGNYYYEMRHWCGVAECRVYDGGGNCLLYKDIEGETWEERETKLKAIIDMEAWDNDE